MGKKKKANKCETCTGRLWLSGPHGPGVCPFYVKEKSCKWQRNGIAVSVWHYIRLNESTKDDS